MLLGILALFLVLDGFTPFRQPHPYRGVEALGFAQEAPPVSAATPIRKLSGNGPLTGGSKSA